MDSEYTLDAKCMNERFEELVIEDIKLTDQFPDITKIIEFVMKTKMITEATWDECGGAQSWSQL